MVKYYCEICRHDHKNGKILCELKRDTGRDSDHRRLIMPLLTSNFFAAISCS